MLSLDQESPLWLSALLESHTTVVTAAHQQQLDPELLYQLGSTQARYALALQPIPRDPVEHLRAAHHYARPYLVRLAQHHPTKLVTVDVGYSYTPRKILRRILDHTLDHLNQVDQWLVWQNHTIRPMPTDGWADSATTLPDDVLPLEPADLEAWLWRIDLVNHLMAERVAALTQAQLDWAAPDEGWTIRHICHHLAHGEVFYAVWLDEALPTEPLARYKEGNQRLFQKLRAGVESTIPIDYFFYDDDLGEFQPEQIAGLALRDEQQALDTVTKSAESPGLEAICS